MPMPVAMSLLWRPWARRADLPLWVLAVCAGVVGALASGVVVGVGQRWAAGQRAAERARAAEMAAEQFAGAAEALLGASGEASERGEAGGDSDVGAARDAPDLSLLRRMVADFAVAHELVSCRVLLPDGGVLADSDAKNVNVHRLPEVWPKSAHARTPGADAGRAGVAQGAEGGRSSRALKIPGRGGATLEMTGAAEEARSGAGSLVAAALGALPAALMVGVCVGGAVRLVGGCALRGALVLRGVVRAAARGDDPATLVITGQAASAKGVSWAGPLGGDGEAWNEVAARLCERANLIATVAMNAAGSARGPEKAGGPETGDLTSAADALWLGLVLLDEQMRVRFANGAAAAFLGRSRERMVGVPIGELLTDSGALRAVAAAASGRVKARQACDFKRGGGEGEGVLRITTRPIRREDAACAMVVIEDVTQQRAIDSARNGFVAQATHELRTPLTNIRLSVEQLIDDEGMDAVARGSAINLISQESRRLERIVGDMLSVSEIEAGSLRLRPGDVRLDQLLRELESDYRAQAKDKDILLQFDLSPKLPVLRGDRDKVCLAVHNLLGNAIKYTPAGGHVTLRAEPVAQGAAGAAGGGGGVTISVQDNGIGIRPEECERVFERFYRADDKRLASITGTGLGLTLAREIARLHGGDITLASELDKGSTFTLTLPAVARGMNATAAGGAAAAVAAGGGAGVEGTTSLSNAGAGPAKPAGVSAGDGKPVREGGADPRRRAA